MKTSSNHICASSSSNRLLKGARKGLWCRAAIFRHIADAECAGARRRTDVDGLTTDLDCAAFLVSREHQLVRVDKGANGRSAFIFPVSAQQDVAA